MSNIRRARLLFIFLLMAGALMADVTGRWSGSVVFNGQNGEKVSGTAILVLKQDGKALTGTAGPNDEAQKAISEGKVEEGFIRFSVEAHPGFFMKFTLKQTGDEITGDINSEHDNQKVTATVSVKREK
ncbi:MAG TPA: hypothetical protein VGL72_25495 [Bryobacteraceae bacterium]|jgi:hypothetical protein